MTFGGVDEVLAWFGRAANYERAGAVPGGFRLDRMRALVEALGRPDRAFRVVHVAGTKGKGTTCAAAASVLDAAGRRVGLYTSPHLVDPRERVRLGPRPAPDAAWLDAAAALEAAVARATPPVGHDDGPTWFELCTALALEVFRREGVDVAVLEVGLGGRLDATNVVVPDVAVITRIGLDHTAVLGRTTAAIAAEKAGIIKPGVPVVAGPEDEDAARVVAGQAAAQGAPLERLGRAVRVEVLGEVGPPARPAVALRIVTPRAVHEVPRAPVAAAVAADLALAVAAAERVPGVGPLGDAVPRGLGRLRWRGRWDVLGGDPVLVVDGAHDAASFLALRATAAARLGPAAPALVLGVSRDKELEAIADVLAAWPGLEVVTCAARTPRAAAPDALAALLAARGVPAWPEADGAAPALARAEALARARGAAVLVTGSLFLAGEVLTLRGEDVAAAWA